MAQISFFEDLKDWLESQRETRHDLIHIINVRGVFRVLPYAFAKRTSEKWIDKGALPLFRTALLSWAASNSSSKRLKIAAGEASERAYAAHDDARADIMEPDAPEAVALSAYAAAVGHITSDIYLTAQSTVYASRASFAARANNVFWKNVEADCQWVESEGDAKTATTALTNTTIWLAGEAEGWAEAWQFAAARLLAINPSYQVWIDWYNRRVIGNSAAFDIPGDKRRVEDKKILARLADATNEDFWDKGATYVNTTLQNWIDEARERVASKTSAQLEPRPQNPDALVWQSDADNRIGVDAQSGVDALDVSDEARDRHYEARDEAQRARALCEKSNAAYEIGGLLDRYLEAMGETIEGVRPGLFVQRGERLRQALSSRIADGAASNYGPLPDQVRDGLKGWQSAHNGFVGLDAKLARIDSALYGPDARRNIVPPDEIRAVAKSADEAAILQPGGREALEGAAAIAPTPPDADDRRSRLSSETAKNFGRKVLSVLWFGIQGGTVSYAIGHWVVANAAWFRAWFADDPATLAVVERILDLLSKLPLS